MSAYDFLENFKMLYICRTLSQSQGWYKQQRQGEWKGITAAGFPSKEMRNNPQYAITVTKPCACFIQLKQPFLQDSTWQGKNKIAWLVQKQQGDKIAKIEKSLVVGKAGISNLAVINALVQFDDKVEYPYAFTLLVASARPGEEG